MLSSFHSAYVLGVQPKKAIEAYKSAGLWQDALSMGITSRLAGLELAELAQKVVLDLEASNRFAEAAQVSLAHLRDVESAVGFYCKANDVSQAKRIVS
jgi:elongator complex protein 1